MTTSADNGVGCLRCAELRARFTNPTTPNPGTFLYGWAKHRIDDHGDSATPRLDCPECTRFAGEPVAVRADIWELWAQTHFMKCHLVSTARLRPAS